MFFAFHDNSEISLPSGEGSVVTQTMADEHRRPLVPQGNSVVHTGENVAPQIEKRNRPSWCRFTCKTPICKRGFSAPTQFINMVIKSNRRQRDSSGSRKTRPVSTG
jgi:hypothetical protein